MGALLHSIGEAVMPNRTVAEFRRDVVAILNNVLRDLDLRNENVAAIRISQAIDALVPPPPRVCTADR